MSTFFETCIFYHKIIQITKHKQCNTKQKKYIIPCAFQFRSKKKKNESFAADKVADSWACWIG